MAQVLSTRAEATGWGPIADVASYKDQQLAVLASAGGDMSEAHLVLLPTAALANSSVPQCLPITAGAASAQVTLSALPSARQFLAVAAVIAYEEDLAHV